MLKKKLIVVSYVVLALSLSACSTNGAEEPATTPPTETTTTTDEKLPKEDAAVDTTTTEENKDVTDDKNAVEENNDMKTTDTTQSRTEDLAQYKEIKLTAAEAYNMFLEKRPDSKVEKISLDYDNKVYYYKVEGYNDKNEYEIKFDAVTGDVAKEETETNENETKVITLDQISKIDDLVTNAMQDAGDDFESLEWELEIDNGKPILEIEIERNDNDLEYVYDIDTGSLLEKDQ